MSIETRKRAADRPRESVTWAVRLPACRSDIWAMVAVVTIVLVANLPYLLGIADPNPVGPRSQIATNRPGLLSGANTLDPTDGYITQALGHLAASDVLHGELPLWNPYEGVGMPLFGEGQSAALFPPTLLLAVDNGQFWEDLLLELVAAVGTFLVLRRIGVGRLASVAGGAAFGLNGAFAWLATSAFNPVAFLPLLVLGIEQAYSASLVRRRGGWWLIAVALALSLYAGFPETAYIDGFVATLWFLWRCGCGDRAHLRAFVVKSAAGAGAGLLLAAPFLVAFATALPHEYVGIHNINAGAMTMPRFAFPQLVLPYVYGPPLGFSDPSGLLAAIWGHAGGFVPISLVFLAALSLVSSKRRGLKLLLVIWLVLVLAKVYGEPPVLRHVLLLVPGGTSVIFFRYSFPAIAFAFAVLAALGVDELATVLAARRRTLTLTMTGGILAVIGLLVYEAYRLVVQLNGGSSHSHWARAQIAWTAAIVAALALCALWRSSRPRWLLAWRAWIAAVLLVIDAGMMFTIHELSAPRAVQLDPSPVSYLKAHLGQQRFFTLGPIAPNYGGNWGLASLNDIDTPLPTRWTRYVNQRLDTYVNPVFFVGNNGGGRPLTDPTPAQELLAHLGAYRDSGVSYVVTLPGQALPQSPRTFTLVLRTPVAWIYHLAGSAQYFTSSSSSCVVIPKGRLQVRVSCPHQTTLLRRELAFPGWSASVDGHNARISVADSIFQSISVPPHTHTVTFSYKPPYFDLSLLGLLMGAGWLVLGVLIPAGRIGAHR